MERAGECRACERESESERRREEYARKALGRDDGSLPGSEMDLIGEDSDEDSRSGRAVSALRLLTEMVLKKHEPGHDE